VVLVLLARDGGLRGRGVWWGRKGGRRVPGSGHSNPTKKHTQEAGGRKVGERGMTACKALVSIRSGRARHTAKPRHGQEREAVHSPHCHDGKHQGAHHHETSKQQKEVLPGQHAPKDVEQHSCNAGGWVGGGGKTGYVMMHEAPQQSPKHHHASPSLQCVCSTGIQSHGCFHRKLHEGGRVRRVSCPLGQGADIKRARARKGGGGGWREQGARARRGYRLKPLRARQVAPLQRLSSGQWSPTRGQPPSPATTHA
jgi:hypothetical protein